MNIKIMKTLIRMYIYQIRVTKLGKVQIFDNAQMLGTI